VIIAGAGQAGAQTAMSLRQSGFEGEIIVLGGEPHLPYQRPPLSKQVLQGEWTAERCLLRKPEFYTQHEIDVRTGVDVTGVDPKAGLLYTADDQTFEYDWLVVCTGSQLNRLVLAGTDESGNMPGVHYLRSLDDALALHPLLKSGMKLAVIGGGYIGLEVAASARKHGCEVAVVEVMDELMKRSALPGIAAFLRKRHESEGVRLHLETAVTGFSGTPALEGVQLDSGETLHVDAAVVGVGVRPAIDWLAGSGIACNRGILVDERCRSNFSNVLAAGDVTEHSHVRYPGRQVLESVQNAIGQARVVAAQITGKDKFYEEVPWFWSEQYDCRLQMAGLPGPDDEILRRGDPGSGSFSLLTISGKRLTGVQAINAARDFMAGKQLIARNEELDVARLGDNETELKELL
jgi:3-phenylpropionate/trans-cinnamate dioxygenase ferredoxin reductase subunit